MSGGVRNHSRREAQAEGKAGDSYGKSKSERHVYVL